MGGWRGSSGIPPGYEGARRAADHRIQPRRDPRLRPRPRQPDRRAHGLQRRPRAPLRDRPRRHRRGRRRATTARSASHARDPDERDAFAGRRPRAARTAGAPSCAGRSAELRAQRRRRAGRRRSPSPATCPRARGSPPRPRWRPRSALALLALAGAEEPDRVELARLCSRVENDWVGAETGLLDQLASLCCEAGSALRIDFATLELETRPARPARLAAGDARLGRAARARRRRLQRPARRVPRDLRAAGDRARQPRGPGRGGRAARSARAPRPPRAHRERARRRDGHRAAGRATCPGRGGCWTGRTRACATTTRRACRRSRPRWRACKDAGAAGARMVGGGFGGSVLALFPPGAGAPRAAPSRSCPAPPAALRYAASRRSLGELLARAGVSAPRRGRRARSRACRGPPRG